MSIELFRAEGLPVLQNRTYANAQEAIACPTGDVVLVQDERTGLVFNAAFDPLRLSYGADYQNEQSHSSVFQRHLDNVAAIIRRHFGGRRLFEVGCGKGYFLEKLLAMGYDATGIDPAYEGSNPNVVKAPFERGLGLSADAIVLRHVLEHIRAPLDFLADIAQANGGRGRIYIEVPCLDWILQKRAWFDVFYEHVNYFRMSDLRRMFGRIDESGHLFGGQYLYVVADLGSLREPSEAAVDRAEFPADFLDGIKRSAHLASGAGRHGTAIWGASSKGVVFLVHMRRAGTDFGVAIDINPAKQGRFLPVTGIPVHSPGKARDVLADDALVFVMNPNYLDEVRMQSGGSYNYSTVDDESVR